MQVFLDYTLREAPNPDSATPMLFIIFSKLCLRI